MDGGDEAAVRFSLMALVGEQVGAAAGGGHGPAGIEGAPHQQLVEVARERNAANGTVVLIQSPYYHIQRVPAGGRMAHHSVLQGIPYPVVERILPLQRLVGVVEGLLVGISRCLPVIGGDKVTAAIAVFARALLPVGRESGILVPASDAPYIIVRIGVFMHYERTPKRGHLALVHERGVVAVHLIVVGVRVRNRLLRGRGGLIAVPLGTAIGLAPGTPRPAICHSRHLIAVQIAAGR